MRISVPTTRVIGLAVPVFLGLLTMAARGDGPQASANGEFSPPAAPVSRSAAPTQPPVSGASSSSAAPTARPAGSLRQRIRVFFTRRSRQQQPAPVNPTPPRPSPDGAELAPSAAQPGEGMASDEERLSVPRAERGEGGAQPTVAQQLKQAPTPGAAAPAPTPLYLNRLLGLEDAPFRTYGWIENSFTGNANGTPANRSNFSVFPNRLANQWQGNQYYLVVENPLEPDDMVNLGFRLDTLFGNDWQFTRDSGFFTGAFPNNHFAGLDFPQIYGEIHLPILTPGGLDIKGGRFYSPAGFSAVPAISRPFISVPYSMNYTPFTFFGVLSTLHLTDRINVYNGTVNGWDRWIDESYHWGYLGFVTWKSRDDKTNLTFIGDWGPDQLPRFAPADAPYVPTATTPPSAALAGKANPYYASSWRNFYSLVVTHQWTEKLLGVTETDHIYDPKILGFSTNGQPSSIYYAGLVHWFLYNFTDELSGGWRSEVFWDPYGAATGSRSTFYETSLVLTLKPKPWLWLRTEARYDWSQFTHPFSDGTRSSQLTLAVATYLLF
jgi:Putative beta-barrel porin-2, OmpL-like. bbp2